MPSQNNPDSLENIENLEQLRAVEAGWNIRVVEVQGPHANGVDTYPQYIALQQEMIKSFIKAQQNSGAKNIDLEKGNCLYAVISYSIIYSQDTKKNICYVI